MIKFFETLRLITAFSRIIPKTDMILLQITNIFCELASTNKEKNEHFNEMILQHVKHLRNNSTPKEYESLLTKTNEV